MALTNVTIAQVQSGGSFDIDYQVTGPLDKVILDGTKERQGDFVFTAQSIGEYSFCFSNEMSTFAEKLVDFEIAVHPPVHQLVYCRCSKNSAANFNRKTGRKRAKSRTSIPPRRKPRTSHRGRRIHHKGVPPLVNHLAKPEILPYAREPELQHCAQHRETDF